MRWVLPILLLVSLSYCRGKNELPRGILKPEKMQLVFWDYINADVYVSDYVKRDTSMDPRVESIRLQKLIFLKHKVTKDEFYKSYTYYVNHPGIMRNMIDSMITKKEKIKKVSGDKKLEH